MQGKGTDPSCGGEPVSIPCSRCATPSGPEGEPPEGIALGLLVFYIVLALAISFLCSLMEAVLLSVTPSYAAMLRERGSRIGARLEALKGDIDRPLSAILSLNTIAHTIGAAGAGAQAAKILGDAWLGVASGVLTLLILVLSEIIPKTLGAVYWRGLTPGVVRMLAPTIWLMWPLVKMSQGITRWIQRDRKAPGVSREELEAMAELGAQTGGIREEETRILRNLFHMRQLHAEDVMTPRTVVVASPETLTVGEALERHEHAFSRIPTYQESLDRVTGYVLKDSLLLAAAHDRHQQPLSELRRRIVTVPEKILLADLLDRLMREKEQIALVVDEYGGTAGVVTMEDILETLLGLEIVDELDRTEDMQRLARERWRERARRLGLLTHGEHKPSDTPKARIQYGLTGGHTGAQIPPDDSKRR